jgi:hypothetical protein
VGCGVAAAPRTNSDARPITIAFADMSTVSYFNQGLP